MLTDVILSSEVNFQNILKKAEKPELLDVELHDHLMAIFQGKHVKELHSMKGITPQSMLPEAVAGAENAFGEVQGPDEDGIDPASLEEKQKKEYAVWQAARAKDFRFAANGKEGNVLAGRFDRYKSSHPDCKKAYEALRIDGRPNIQAQEDFRREWAMKKFENYKLEMRKVTTHKRTHWRKGQYQTLGRTAKKEGGGRLGWLQARGLQNDDGDEYDDDGRRWSMPRKRRSTETSLSAMTTAMTTKTTTAKTTPRGKQTHPYPQCPQCPHYPPPLLLHLLRILLRILFASPPYPPHPASSSSLLRPLLFLHPLLQLRPPSFLLRGVRWTPTA
jgi:hypothetical protein